MVELSRRGFLLGSCAVATVAAAPAFEWPKVVPVFEGYVGEWRGIPIRMVGDLATLARRHAIPTVYGNKYVAYIHPCVESAFRRAIDAN